MDRLVMEQCMATHRLLITLIKPTLANYWTLSWRKVLRNPSDEVWTRKSWALEASSALVDVIYNQLPLSLHSDSFQFPSASIFQNFVAQKQIKTQWRLSWRRKIRHTKAGNKTLMGAFGIGCWTLETRTAFNNVFGLLLKTTFIAL